MAKNISSKKTNFANNKPNCLKRTRRTQKANLQQVTLVDENGTKRKYRLSAQEIKTMKKAA